MRWITTPPASVQYKWVSLHKPCLICSSSVFYSRVELSGVKPYLPLLTVGEVKAKEEFETWEIRWVLFGVLSYSVLTSVCSVFQWKKKRMRRFVAASELLTCVSDHLVSGWRGKGERWGRERSRRAGACHSKVPLLSTMEQIYKWNYRIHWTHDSILCTFCYHFFLHWILCVKLKAYDEQFAIVDIRRIAAWQACEGSWT